MGYYGIFRKDDVITFCCLLPKICFDSIREAKPYKLIFTSGSLPEKKIMEEVSNLSFQKHHTFKLTNYKNQCYLAIKSTVGTSELKINYIDTKAPTYEQQL